MKKRRFILIGLVIILSLTFKSALADDGELTSKEISQEFVLPYLDLLPDAYKDAVPEAEHTFTSYMKFYTQAQAADGTVGPRIQNNIDGVEVRQDEFVKPLIGVYIKGIVEGVDTAGGFVGHGLRDAYGAVSLDDGLTWKSTNLSESAFKSSFDETLREDIGLYENVGDGFEYAGDVTNIFFTIAGNKVLVAWQSRYCAAGEPNFSLQDDDPRRLAIASYLGINLEDPSPDDLYLIDMYGVGGSQGFVDYAESEFEAAYEVGVVPYNCLWTARGVLVNGDDPRTEPIEESFMRWYNPERLTSGVRDVNRIETQCVAGAGCTITWQEDPDGLRPGQGEGPGEGWSGATAHSQTDIWYSYIDFEDFEPVQDPEDDTGATVLTLEDFELIAAAGDITQEPKPFVPFAMPMRLSDNAKCNADNPQPYCNGSAISDLFPEVLNPLDYGMKDMCMDTVEIEIGPQQGGQLDKLCVTDDGLPIVGNTAATRPRLNLFGYDIDDDGDNDNAYVLVVAEEDKGLGAFGFTEEGEPCSTKEGEGTCIPFDEGKNAQYYTFSMSLTDENVGENNRDGLIKNLTHHGHQINQPEVNWQTGEFFPVANTADFWNFVKTDEGGAVIADYNYDIYNTEIARRGSLLAQDFLKVSKGTSGPVFDNFYYLPLVVNSCAIELSTTITTSRQVEEEDPGGLVALLTWKQGIMNQGGPADVMARRILYEGDANPYAFRNMACEDWAYTDGSNPNYPDGLCLDSAINISGTIPDTCVDSATGLEVTCPQVDLSQGTTFGISDTDPVIQGKTIEPNTTKVLSWHMCPASFTTVSQTDGTSVVTCDTDARTDNSTLVDQSWYNPLEVAKGHRGFLDGDFVMILYAWSPNWRLNAVGNDRYELYIRRSFDGAQTWTTTPANFDASNGETYSGDGTITCETWRSAETGTGEVSEPRVCNEYAAGAAEQARNVTQYNSMATTTLDPRYAMSGSPGGASISADPFETDYTFTEEDIFDPSRFFIVYETGDNTTTAEGEPTPLDLFYSRAINFGDDFTVWAEDDDLSVCYPSDPHGSVQVPEEHIGSGFCNEFDLTERGIQGLESGEASLAANPGGEFLYIGWSELLLDGSEEVAESAAMVRRIWWIDGYISETFGWDFVAGSLENVPEVLE